MKKVLFLIGFIGLFASCTHGVSTTSNDVDSVSVDSTVVDSAVIDSTLA